VFLHIRESAIIELAKCPTDRLIAFVDSAELAERARVDGFKRTAVNAKPLNPANIKRIAAQTDYVVMWNESYSLQQIAEVARVAKVIVPTVNDPAEAARLKRAGVAGIMSDVLRSRQAVQRGGSGG
jgi:glycerophosphoryl diester phosphodiesterase